MLRDEPLAGTATHVRTWVLLEHSGPWGNDALLDARLPDGLGPALKQQARTYRAKILLVRRARAKRDPERLNVFAAHADPRRPRVEHGTVADLREVLDLDLTSFRDGRLERAGAVRRLAVLRLHQRPPRRLLCGVRPAGRDGARRRVPGADLGGLAHRR